MPQTPSRLRLNPPSRPDPTPARAPTPRLTLKPPAAPEQGAQAEEDLIGRRGQRTPAPPEPPGYFSKRQLEAMYNKAHSPPPPFPTFPSSQTRPIEDMSLGDYVDRPLTPLVPQARAALGLLSESQTQPLQESIYFQGITQYQGEDSDLEESQEDPDRRFSREEEYEEEEYEEEVREEREGRRIEQRGDISSYTQASADVSSASRQRRRAPYTNTSGGRKGSELQTHNPSSTGRVVDEPIRLPPRLPPNQDNSQELKDDTPTISFSFELYTKAFWEKDVKTSIIFATSEEYTYNGSKDFNITRHHRRISKEASDWALQRDQPAHLISVLATPSHGKLAKNKQQDVLAKDRAQWGSVLLTLNRFSEQGHLDLRVELIYHFARNRTGELPTMSKSGQTVQKPIITRSASSIQSSHIPTANQLLQRQAAHEADPSEAAYEALLAKWACKAHICPNKGFYCYVDKINGKHFKLDTPTAKQWQILISTDPSGRLSDNEPPDQIRRRLQKMYDSEQKKEKKEASKGLPFGGMPPPAWPASATPYTYLPPYQQSPYSLPLPLPLPHTPPSTSELSSVRTSRLKAELLSRGVDSPERYSSSSRSRSRSQISTSYTPHPEQRSSPVDADLDEYIKWMKEKKKIFAADFEQAFEILLDQGYTTETIQQWKTEEKWKELGIKPGIGLQLATNISKWGRQRSISQPHQPRISAPRKQRQSLVSPYMNVIQGRSRPDKGVILPSIEQDDREGIRAHSETDWEHYQGDQDLDDLDWQDDTQATQ